VKHLALFLSESGDSPVTPFSQVSDTPFPRFFLQSEIETLREDYLNETDSR